MNKLATKPVLVIIACLLFVMGSHRVFAAPLQATTSTPTSTLPSRTPTAIYLAPTQTTTPSGMPTITLTPSPTSGTPSNTYTPTTTPSPSPTTTLAPLPALTLIYPILTNTPTVTISPTMRLGTGTPAPDTVEGTNVAPRLKVLAIVLIFLWLILAGFLIVYIRQFK